jgi:rhamnulokinase
MAGEPAPGAAFLASGTWLLVGAERPDPDTSVEARRANFTNEAGVLGGTRFLKNVPGFWLIEQCRQQWGHPPIGELLAAAAAVAGGPCFDPQDPQLLAPSDMEGTVRRLAGLASSAGRDVVTRCVVDSMVAGAVSALEQLARLSAAPVSELHLLGGGSRDDLFVRLVHEQTGFPLLRGPAEATAIGNALVQGVALGCYADLVEARRAVDTRGRVA